MGDEAAISDVTRISQTLNLWEGEILSRFTWKGMNLMYGRFAIRHKI